MATCPINFKKKSKEARGSVQIRVRMSTKELFAIKQKAKALGMTISALMRKGALAYEPEQEKQ